jgi:hypothetical protein
MEKNINSKIPVYLDISGDTPLDQAISVMYQDYLEAKNLEGLSKESAVCVIAQGFARYLLDHPTELELVTKEMEVAERARKEKYPDMPL